MSDMAGAAQAICNRRMHVGFDKFCLRIGMTGVTEALHSVFEHILKVGSMGVMAGAAITPGKRSMAVLHGLSLPSLCMARKTKIGPAYREEKFVLSRMRSMAGETPLVAGYRRMFESHIFRLFRMAFETELIAFLSEKHRTFRGMGVMTGGAHSSLEGLVFHRSPTLQARRVMTGSAKSSPLLGRPEGFRRPWRIMAAIALSRRNRPMGARFQKLGL